MKPASFDYVRPSRIEEVLELIEQHGPDARILAGGQSLIAMLNMRVAKPRLLIDISGLRSAAYISDNGSSIAVGCATRQVELQRWQPLDRKLPLLAKVLPWIGHIQTRSRGTVCGSIAHADPSSELPLCMVLLEGQVVLRNRRRTRVISADEFFIGPLQTARLDGEMISEVRLPVLGDSAGVAFTEMSIRHGDFALVAVGAVAEPGGVRIAVGGAADRPVARTLPHISGDDLKDALNDFAWSLDCQDDLHATAAYRRHLVRTLGMQIVEEACRCQS
jgi:2-furoyl-CoA dehydrogenase FAD binding subunit